MPSYENRNSAMKDEIAYAYVWKRKLQLGLFMKVEKYAKLWK